MKRIFCCCIAMASLLAVRPVLAFDSNIPPQGLPSAVDYAATLLPARTGVVSWKTLAKVEAVNEGGRIVPKFDATISALDRTNISVQGFKLPMDLGDRQRHFLISAVPPHCPFCLPAGPDAVMEVKAATPVAYAIEPVLLTGKLILVKDDSYGLLYQLVDARPVR